MKRVLAVDDNSDQLLVTRLSLKGHYMVECCTSLGEFTAAIGTTVPDVVLLDLHVGLLHARDFVAAMRGSALELVPIVLISGSVELEEESRALGCAASLQKPYGIMDLRRLLAKLLEEGGAG